MEFDNKFIARQSRLRDEQPLSGGHYDCDKKKSSIELTKLKQDRSSHRWCYELWLAACLYVGASISSVWSWRCCLCRGAGCLQANDHWNGNGFVKIVIVFKRFDWLTISKCCTCASRFLAALDWWCRGVVSSRHVHAMTQRWSCLS